jgi:type I restriction enzyme S subunit
MRDGWIETTLGDIAEVVGGGTPSTAVSEYWDGNIIWLTPTEITAQDGKVVSDSIRKISALGLKGSGAQMLPKETVILTSRASVGYVALAGAELCTNQGFQSLIPKKTVLPKFLMFWIQHNRTEFESRSAGSTFKEISKSNVKGIKISVPPISEQKRIVDLISSVDSYIDALQRHLESAEKFRSAVLHELFTAGSDGWTETTIGEVVNVINGGTPSTKNARYWGGEIVWITTTELTASDGQKVNTSKRTLTEEGLNSGAARLVRSGTTLVGTTATIGTCALAACSLSFNQQISGLIPKDDKLRDEYLFYLIQWMRPTLEGLAAGTSFKRISTLVLKTIPLNFPPLSEQERIVEIISSIDELVNEIVRTLEKSKNLRSGLLSKLLSGEHEIPSGYDKVVGAAL